MIIPIVSLVALSLVLFLCYNTFKSLPTSKKVKVLKTIGKIGIFASLGGFVLSVIVLFF
jgi:hypothetical protein